MFLMKSKKSKFDETLCYTFRPYCGNDDKPPKGAKNDAYYSGKGTRAACLKAGIGVGIYIERDKKLPANSLQKIKYVGEKHEKKFKKVGITNTDELVKKMKKKTIPEKEKILKRVLVKKGGLLDVRAYNSTLLYLYRHGNGDLPSCKKMKPPTD